MIRIVLLITGAILLIVEQYIKSVPVQLQFNVFITGILLLGVPHGAADLLVATRNSQLEKESFSKLKFLVKYLTRLVLFAAILWFFPVTGNILFILFAAYHFGETDLHQFRTNTFSGKFFAISYGLLILGVILLVHFEEVKLLFLQFNSGVKYESYINWINHYRYTILSCLSILFFSGAFFYFSVNRNSEQLHGGFLVQLGTALFMLYHLPMILGFTFYFIMWHSLLSLRNIINYLRKNNLFSITLISKQLILYSTIAIAGTALFGLTGFMFIGKNAVIVYVFLALAVLTVPHMEVMQSMYKNMRANNSIKKDDKCML
jgi:beta-carotene 15,15'-dioxygenase